MAATLATRKLWLALVPETIQAAVRRCSTCSAVDIEVAGIWRVVAASAVTTWWLEFKNQITTCGPDGRGG